MSIIRKNWSALSSLTRQWTVEDDEEVERERRRKTRSSSSTMEPDDSPMELGDSPMEPDDSPMEPGDSPIGDVDQGPESGSQASETSGLAQLQEDFVEMIRRRDERRRMRHMETLRRQQQEEEEGGEGTEARVELLGDVEDVEQPRPAQDPRTRASVSPTALSPTALSPTALSPTALSPTALSSTALSPTALSPTALSPTALSSSSRVSAGESQNENGSSEPDRASSTTTTKESSRKFVSSLSISFDKSPSSPTETGRLVTPLSPGSLPRRAPPEVLPRSPGHGPAQSPTHNGDTGECENGSPGSFEAAERPAFTRQSSRTVSFRMMKKKEEQSVPLQRSSSVRIGSKNFEPDKSHNQEEDQQSPFQRNSRQRVSARAIQEKMEKLAQASQKWEMVKSPTLAHKTVYLVDEVSRKRGMFEREQAAGESNPVTSKQDLRSFSSGIADRISRWVHKSGSSPSASDLRHVNISSKRTLFERGHNERQASSSPNK